MKKIFLTLVSIAVFSWTIGNQSLCVANETIVIKFGHINSATHPIGKAAELFAKLASEKSNGKVKVEVFPSSQLGGERELIEGMVVGTVDMAQTTSSMLGQFAKPYYINSVPYGFRDYDHVHKVMWGKIGQEMAAELLKRGIRVITANWDNPPRTLHTIRPIHKPDDVNGLKLRLPENPTYIECWKAWGANPTPIPYPEVYSALKLGIAEGVEGSVIGNYTQSFYEVTKFTTETNHVKEPAMILMSEKLYKKLPSDVRMVIKKAAEEAGDWERKSLGEYLESYKIKLKEKGVTFIKTDPSLWQAKLEESGAIDRLWHIWGDKTLYDRIQAVK
jgi:tripartite ATP-independent transporter DctP family solute receptor